jgi:hypothetical protein
MIIISSSVKFSGLWSKDLNRDSPKSLDPGPELMNMDQQTFLSCFYCSTPIVNSTLDKDDRKPGTVFREHYPKAPRSPVV